MTDSDDRKVVKAAVPSTQLNILTRIDVAGATRSGSLEGQAALLDNSGDSIGKGTTSLRTVCRQGQVLNWLLYNADVRKRPDGTWPPFARISNIVFVHSDMAVDYNPVCTDLDIYGSVAEVLSPFTPVYYYWAGIVRPDLTPGVYRYRLIIECATEDPNRKLYFNLDGPSLDVMPLGSASRSQR